MPALIPVRRTGPEILDDPAVPDAVRVRSLHDVARANAWFGGSRAARRALRGALQAPRGSQRTLLDVGTGVADIPARTARDAMRAGVTVRVVGVDTSAALLRAAGDRLAAGVVADARALPFRTGSVDVVLCSQLLHHFESADARRVVSELHRVARAHVVISDLRRSWVAAGGFWLASRVLRFHAVTRRDGLTSVLRGFTAGELAGLVRDATGVTPRVRRGAGWRLTALWRPDGR